MALAIIFDSVGAGEWLVLLAVLLVVMGPKRLPSTARTIGSYYSKFRRAADSFKRQLMDMDYEMEREVEKVRREAEAAMSVPDDPPEFSEGLEEGEGYGEEEYGRDDLSDDGMADGSVEETSMAESKAAEPAVDDDGNKPA